MDYRCTVCHALLYSGNTAYFNGKHFCTVDYVGLINRIEPLVNKVIGEMQDEHAARNPED